MNTLIDWVSCSFKALKNLDDIFTYLFLEKNKFLPCNPYNNYHYGVRFERITILFSIIEVNNDKYYDVFFNLSGEGCRQYETMRGKYFNWIDFFKNLHDGFGGFYSFHVSRVDIALDIKDNSVPDMQKILKIVDERKYISVCRKNTTIRGSEEVAYFGSPQSDTRLRIYNKALERNFTNDEKWVRFEYQLRNKSAARFFNHLFTINNLGQAMLDFLNSSVRFTVKPNIDNEKNRNQNRLSSCGWWKKLIKTAGEVTKFEVPGIEYNLARTQAYLSNQVAPTLNAYVEAHGGDISPLMQMLEDNKFRMKDKHQKIIQDGLQITERMLKAQKDVEDFELKYFRKQKEKQLLEFEDCFEIEA